MKRKKLAAMAGLLIMLGSVLPVSAAESLETFDYKAYADTYPDLKAAFGYDAATLYNHYVIAGKAEGRVAVFTGETQQTQVQATTTTPTTTPTTTEALDPLPPLDETKHPAWIDARTDASVMSNARLRTEHDRLHEYMVANNLFSEGTMHRRGELADEIRARQRAYDRYLDAKEWVEDEDTYSVKAVERLKAVERDPVYQRAVATDITPILDF